MDAGVDGTSGASAQKAVVLVFKHEIGPAIAQHLLMAEKIVLTEIQSL